MTESYGLLSLALLLVFEGAILYACDMRLGRAVYKWFSDMTSESPLEIADAKGFIYQRGAHARFSLATMCALVQTGLAFHYGYMTSLGAIPYTALQMVMLMIGFYCGPFFVRLWNRKKPILDVVDQLESGQTNIADEARRAAEVIKGKWSDSFGERMRKAASSFRRSVAETKPAEADQNTSATVTPSAAPNSGEVATPPVPDPTTYVSDFISKAPGGTHGGNGSVDTH